MITILAVALAVVLLLILFWQRYLGTLIQLASLLAAVLLMIWLQDHGYFDNRQRSEQRMRSLPDSRQ